MTAVVFRSDRQRYDAGVALMGAALVAFLALSPAPGAAPRDDRGPLAARVAELEGRLARVEGEQASMQKTLQEIAARLEALGRASQTADLRLDLEALRRQVESLAHRASSPTAPGAAPPASAPPSAHPEAAPEAGVASLPSLPRVSPSPGGTGEPSPAPPSRVSSPALPAGAPAGEELYSQAHREYIGGRYDVAAEAFLEFLRANPSHPKAPNAQYWVGECLYSQKRFPEAREAFGKVLQRYPESAKARAAELKVGFCHLAEGSAGGARESFHRVVQSYPGTDEAQIAQDRLDRLDAP